MCPQDAARRAHLGLAAALVWASALWLFAVPLARADTPTAEYTVVFDATWSEQTHPGELPPSPHFSGLIGGLHDDGVSFWDVGALASVGIERMAETGSKTQLTNEVNAAIAAGTANQLLSGGGIGTSPGSISLSFTAHADFPRMTLVSMLAPSPDWFVGTDSLALMNGLRWRYQIVVPLYVYDAGTDSGTDFTSANADTNPADPITLFDTGYFAPPKSLVGTFTITRTDAVPPLPAASPAGLAVLALAIGGLGYRIAARRGSTR